MSVDRLGIHEICDVVLLFRNLTLKKNLHFMSSGQDIGNHDSDTHQTKAGDFGFDKKYL